MFAKCDPCETRLSLPVVPFEAKVRIALSFVEQLCHSGYVVLIPSLLHKIQIGHVEISLRRVPLFVRHNLCLQVTLACLLSLPLILFGGPPRLFGLDLSLSGFGRRNV